MPEITESYEFAVEGMPEIVVRNRAGSITIARGATGQVAIRITKRAHGHLLSTVTEDDLARIVVNVVQSGNRIRVETDQHESGGILKSYQVDIAITTPTETNLELRMNAGNVDVRDISGAIESTVNAGNFDAYGTTLARHSSLTVNAGNLTLEGALAAGGALDAEVNAGNLRLRLPHDTPANLEARTDVGSIDIDGWPVRVSRRVVQQEAAGPLGTNPQGTLRLRVNTGSISVRSM
jgi:hypothetical protein